MCGPLLTLAPVDRLLFLALPVLRVHVKMRLQPHAHRIAVGGGVALGSG